MTDPQHPEHPGAPAPGSQPQNDTTAMPAAANTQAYPLPQAAPQQPGQAPGAGPAPAYGQAPGYGQQPPAAGARTNVLAIVTLIAAFVMPIAGIITGHLSLRELRTSGEEGHGLAKAGLILSYVFTALGLLAVILGLILFFVGINAGMSGHWIGWEDSMHMNEYGYHYDS